MTTFASVVLAFTVFSWGGSKPISRSFTDLLGIDTVNCWPLRLSGTNSVRKIADSGLDVCIRYENYRRWQREKRGTYDWARIRREVTEDLRQFAGVDRWTMTLANSEIYLGVPLPALKQDPEFADAARRALGREPDFGFTSRDGIFQPTNGAAFKGCRGVIGHDNALLETIRWFVREGSPTLKFTGIVRDEVHKLKPGNIVWSEPLFGGVPSVTDMGADWLYEYSEYLTLGSLRGMVSGPRAAGKPFMPTVTTYYYQPQKGEHPFARDKDGKPLVVDMTQSGDEALIKTWLAVGAVKAEALSIFHADSWEWGEKATKAYLADSDTPVKVVAELGAAERYGAFIKNRLKPVGELLKRAENARAPLAILMPQETSLAGGWLFALHHYRRMIELKLGEHGVNYDILSGGEASDPEILAKYKYVLLPMCNVLYEEKDAALKAASERGTVIVLDGHSLQYFKGRYAHEELHPEIKYYHIWNKPAETYEPLVAWIKSKKAELQASERAWSTGGLDGETFTFVKFAKGVNYVIVVNNRRREGGGILTDFKKTPAGKMPMPYRPYGASQRIMTHVRAGEGVEIRELFAPEGKDPLVARRGGNEWIIEGDYGPGEGRIFEIRRK